MDTFLFVMLFILAAGALGILIVRKKNLLFILYPIVIGMLICITCLSDEAYEPITMNGSSLKHDVGYADNTWLYIDDNNNNGFGGAWARMNRYALNKGTYTVHANYFTNVDGNMLSVVDDGEYIMTKNLSPNETETEITFTLEQDSQEIVIQFNYVGLGSLYAYSLELSAQDGFYNDCGYYVVILMLLGIFGTAFYLYARKNEISAKKLGTVMGLMAIGLFSFVPYMNGSLPWGDDLCYHLARIEGIKDGILDGQLPVMVYPEALKGYGYTNLMYPNLFLYIPAIIRLFGVSIAASYKTLILLSCIATAFITYYSVKVISNNPKAAILASAIYTLCPYRFTNLYARGALGEALALTFVPLLIAGLYHVIIGDKKKWWVLTLGMTGLVSSHVLSMMIGAIICVLCALIYIVKIFKEKRVLPILKAAGLFAALNAAFLIPFVVMYKSGGLWMAMLGISMYGEYSLEFTKLFGMFRFEDYRILALGLPVCALAGVCAFYFIRRAFTSSKKDDLTSVKVNSEEASVSQEVSEESSNGFVLFMFVGGLICVGLLLGQFRAFKFMEIGIFKWFFETVQFPWRLLGFASALFAMAGSICLFRDESLKKVAVAIGVGLVIITGVATTRYEDDDFSYKSYDSTYTKGHESKVVGIPKGDNTIVYPYEWRQEGIYDNVIVPGAVRATDSTQLYVESYSREGTTTNLTYITSDEGMEIELPVIYYPGYRMVNEHGENVDVYMGNNRLVAFKAQADGLEHSVKLTFHRGILNTLAFIISLFTAVGSLVYAIAIKYGFSIRLLIEKKKKE